MKPWKIQKFLGDVIYDLRQRNLLLVAIMLIVAIIAVPVLVSTSGPGASPGPVGLTATASAKANPEGESAVLAYQPGVRNFKQRLRELSAKDPFKQHYPAPSSSAASTGSDQLAQAVTGSSTGGSSGVGGGSTGGNGSGSGSGGGNTGKVTNHITYYWWETDIQFGEAGTALAQQNNVKPFQFLPSTDKPVLTYLGAVGGSQAVFLVSRDVVSVGGDGTCFPTADDCQLLGLNGGKGADLIYGPDGKTYHVQVLQVRRVTGSKPPNF